jgi:hypothetical protein
MDELSEEDKLTVARARKIQRFLSQPFHVAEVFTGIAGQVRAARRHDQGLQGRRRRRIRPPARSRPSTWSAPSRKRSRRPTGSEGEFGVLEGHAPFMSTIRDGALKVYKTDGAAALRKSASRADFAEVGAERPHRAGGARRGLSSIRTRT